MFLKRNDSTVRQTALNGGYSQCWPSDWLPSDEEGLRVIGVDYSTTLSEWLPSCPLKQKEYDFQTYFTTTFYKLCVFLVIVHSKDAQTN